jgi:hypothetical protein
MLGFALGKTLIADGCALKKPHQSDGAFQTTIKPKTMKTNSSTPTIGT